MLQQKRDSPELKELSAKAAAELSAENAAQSERQSKQNSLLADFNESVFSLGKLKEQTAELKEELEEVKREHASCVSSANILADMKNSFEGYSSSVRRLMSGAAHDRRHRRSDNRYFCRHRISVPKEYETAIEMCLGAALQDVVVKTQEDAKYVIKYLRQNNLGRVTFLPLDTLKVRTFSSGEKDTLKQADTVGVASELISCRQGCEQALEFLLGRTVITNDNDSASEIIKNSGFNVRAVSLGGDVFNPSGSITGGSTGKSKSGFVSRDRRQEELAEKSQKLEAKRSELETKAAESQREEQELADSIEQARKELQTIQIETAKGKEKINTLEAAAADNGKETDKLNGQIKELEEQSMTLEAEKASVTALMEEMRRSSDTKSEGL